MQAISKQLLVELLKESSDGPCLSISQATHRSFPENGQDQIRFRNLIKELEHSLAQHEGKADTAKLLAPFKQLAEDTEFWKYSLDGLVVLGNAKRFHIFKLQRPVADFAVVADTFHLKPLMRVLQTSDRYHVLALSRSSATLYEGNRYQLDPVGTASTFPHRNHEEEIARSLPGDRLEHQEHSATITQQTESYFRAVDKAVIEEFSAASELPLILVTLPEHQGVFRKLSHNNFLLEQGVAIDPTSLKTEELRKRVWEVMEPIHHQRTRQEIDRFKQAQGTGLAQDNIDDVYQAAKQGRVQLLFVDADQRIAGRLLSDPDRIEYVGDFSHPEAEDVLDDIAEMVLRQGGEVLVVPSDIMPSVTGLAALYRF